MLLHMQWLSEPAGRQGWIKAIPLGSPPTHCDHLHRGNRYLRVVCWSAASDAFPAWPYSPKSSESELDELQKLIAEFSLFAACPSTDGATAGPDSILT